VLCMAVELRTGSCSTKLPSSGMHSTRQASQVARRRMSIWPMPPGGGLKLVGTCSGAASSTWPS